MTQFRQNKIQSFAFIISTCIALALAYCFTINMNMTNSASGRNENILKSKINPNTAAVESLTRLPDIGITRAQAIINYRENYMQKNNNTVAFKTPDDLENITGIGPKTIQNLSRWLEFE